MLLAVLLLSLAFTQATRAEDRLLVGPKSQNVSLGTGGTFSCSGYGSILWTVRNTHLNYELFESWNISYAFNSSSNSSNWSIITLPGTKANNNSDLFCTVLPEDVHNNQQSETVYLKIQGLLAPVGNLKLSYSSLAAILTWTEPYSLNGVSKYYLVTALDVTASTSFPLVNTTRAEVNITTDELTACHFYNFSVQACNAVGLGGITYVSEFFSGAPVAPEQSAVMVKDIDIDEHGTMAYVLLEFTATSKCFREQNISFSAVIHPEEINAQLFVDYLDSDQVQLAVHGLPPNAQLSVDVHLSNSFGDDVTTGISFNTYEIIDVTVTQNNGSICFSCVFLTHSKASGCYITLMPDQDIMDKCSRDATINSMLTVSHNTSAQDTNSVKECKQGHLYEGNYILSGVLIDSSGSTQPRVVITKSTFLQGRTCTTEDSSSFRTSLSSVPEQTTVGISTSTEGFLIPSIIIGTFTGLVLVVIAVMIGVVLYKKYGGANSGQVTITSARNQQTCVTVEYVKDAAQSFSNGESFASSEAYNKGTNSEQSQTSEEVKHQIYRIDCGETTLPYEFGVDHRNLKPSVTSSSPFFEHDAESDGSGDYDHLNTEDLDPFEEAGVES